MELLGSSDFESILCNLHDGLYFTDRERRILYWNKAAEEITGFSSEEVVGKSCMDNILCHVDSFGTMLCKGVCPLAASILDGKAREADVFLHHKDGYRVPVSVRTSPLRNAQGKVTGGIELFANTNQEGFLWDKLQELQRLALIDPLSGLPNRKYLEQQLVSQASQLDRFQLPYGVASFRVQDMPAFLRTHGEAVADRLIRILADTMRQNIRPYDMVGRLDYDEFLGVFPNVDTFALHALCRRLTQLGIHSTMRCDDGSRLGFLLQLKTCMASAQESTSALLLRLDSSQYMRVALPLVS